MSTQSISDVLSIVAMNAIESKIGSLVNTFAQKLNAKHNIDCKELIKLWNSTNKEITIKYKKPQEKEDGEKMNTCPYTPKNGKNKGVECGKKCKGDFCSSHTPEKLEKERLKREAKKKENEAKKSSSDEEKPVKKQNKKPVKKQKESDDEDTSDVSDAE